MRSAHHDPRRQLNIVGLVARPISTLNPGQQCAMRHQDGLYWYPYIVVAQHHMIDLGGRRLLPLPGRTVVKLEMYSWDVPSETLVYLVDGITEDLKLPGLIK